MNPKECESVDQTLHQKCESIKEVLNKANGITEGLVDAAPGECYERRESDTRLASLANELVSIQEKSETLLDYLIQISDAI